MTFYTKKKGKELAGKIMMKKEIVIELWKAVAEQDAVKLRTFFTKDAVVRWHATREEFQTEEYIRANCEYPGDWRGEVERVEECGTVVIAAVRVWLADESASFHAVAFYEFCGDLIQKADEYWGDDGEAPEWRKKMKVGTRF